MKLPLYDIPSHHDILSFSLAVLSRAFLGVSVSMLDWCSSNDQLLGIYIEGATTADE